MRLALYTAENGGWCEGGNRDELYNLVRDRMAAAVRAGLPVFISDSWNATVSIDGAELTLDSVSYNGALAPQATAQDIGFILSGNALPNSGPLTG